MNSDKEYLRIIKELFEAFTQRGDIEPLLEAVSDDVQIRLTIADGTPLSGVFHGRAGVRQYFERNAETVQTSEFDILNYLSGGDQVAVVGRETLTVIRSGSVFKNSDWVTLFTFRDGKVVQILVVEDTSGIVAAYR
jgi:ketosteroid isomerase-like protein